MRITDYGRFWKNVTKSEACCWIWDGTSGGNSGYGRLRWNGKQEGAHRVSWMIHFGQIPDGMFVCHHCDVRLCVRPDHLFLGTHLENMRDMARKGRCPGRRSGPREVCGEKNGQSKLTNEAVAYIRQVYVRGEITYYDLAAKFEVHPVLIGKVIRREVWKHLP